MLAFSLKKTLNSKFSLCQLLQLKKLQFSNRTLINGGASQPICNNILSKSLAYRRPSSFDYGGKSTANYFPENSYRQYGSMIKAMARHGVVPDVIPKAPKYLMAIAYPSGVEACEGNILTPRQTKDMPVCAWCAEKGAYYTLCMVDADAPSRKTPRAREWQHWLVVNISGTDMSSGQVLSSYIGSGPPEGTGLHRYVFLLYKQPSGRIAFKEKRLLANSGQGRANFKIAAFAQKYKLGSPVSGNFYQAEYDDYVPELYEKLGM